MRTKQLPTIISTLGLFILMISVLVSCEKSQPVEDPQHFDLDVTFHTENLKDHSNKGFGFLKFRQDPDTARIITLDTYVFNLLPNILTCCKELQIHSPTQPAPMPPGLR